MLGPARAPVCCACWRWCCASQPLGSDCQAQDPTNPAAPPRCPPAYMLLRQLRRARLLCSRAAPSHTAQPCPKSTCTRTLHSLGPLSKTAAYNQDCDDYFWRQCAAWQAAPRRPALRPAEARRSRGRVKSSERLRPQGTPIMQTPKEGRASRGTANCQRLDSVWTPEGGPSHAGAICPLIAIQDLLMAIAPCHSTNAVD